MYTNLPMSAFTLPAYAALLFDAAVQYIDHEFEDYQIKPEGDSITMVKIGVVSAFNRTDLRIVVEGVQSEQDAYEGLEAPMVDRELDYTVIPHPRSGDFVGFCTQILRSSRPPSFEEVVAFRAALCTIRGESVTAEGLGLPESVTIFIEPASV